VGNALADRDERRMIRRGKCADQEEVFVRGGTRRIVAPSLLSFRLHDSSNPVDPRRSRPPAPHNTFPCPGEQVTSFHSQVIEFPPWLSPAASLLWPRRSARAITRRTSTPAAV